MNELLGKSQNYGLLTAEVQKSIAEEQALFVIAMQFPRDEEVSRERILIACQRQQLAENALYSYPRGGQTIEGPSIRLAEVAARNFGHLDYGWKMFPVIDGATQTEVIAYCIDRQTGTRARREFTVSHYRVTRSGRTLLVDERDVYEKCANEAARRMRACILAIVPSDIIEDAVEQVKQTLMSASKKPLTERIKAMTSAFQTDFGVSKAALEKWAARKIESCTEAQMVKLRAIYKSLQDGQGKPEDFFNSEVVAEATEVKDVTPVAPKDKKKDKKDKVADEPPKTGDAPAEVEVKSEATEDQPPTDEPEVPTVNLDDLSFGG